MKEKLTPKGLLTFVALSLLATVGVQAQENRGMTTEKWQCLDRLDFSNKTVLVGLTRVAGDSEDRGFGEVSVAGVTYRALFQVAGFDRRWDFGEELNYASIIRPDGDGLYYDFSTVEDGGKTNPSQHFECVVAIPERSGTWLDSDRGRSGGQ